MKNINFIKTGMENFCCYINPVEYEFKNNKIILITGPNGSGKTTIYDSIPFTLYGFTTKGLKGEDVVNNETKKNCHTYVEFTEENSGVSNHYRVDRYYKHSKFGETVLLQKNGDVIKKGHKEVLPEIEKILVSQKLFTNTLLFGQKVKNFFTDLTDSEQKEIFRKVLQLDDYVLYYDETSKLIKEKITEIEKFDNNTNLNNSLLESVNKDILLINESKKLFDIKKQSEIEKLKSELILSNKNLDDLKEISKQYSYIDIDKLLDEVNNNISELKNKIESINLSYKSDLKSLEDNKNFKESEFNLKLNDLITKENLEKVKIISSIETEIQKYKQEVNKIDQDFCSKNESFNVELKNNSNMKIKNDLEIFSLKSALDKPESTCPTCGKPLTDSIVKENLLKKLQDFILDNESISSRENEIKNILKELEENKNITISNLNSNILNLTENVKNIELNYLEKEKEIKNRLNEALSRLSKMFFEQVEKINNEFNNSKKDIEEKLKELLLDKDTKNNLKLNKELNNVKISEENSKIENINNLLKYKMEEEYDDKILSSYYEKKENLIKENIILVQKKEISNDDLKILEFWKVAFSSTGIPSILIDESIPFLNSKVSNYLQMINSRYIVSFDTISSTKAGEYRDKINVNVVDTKTKANHRKQLSGGQTRIIDITILLALCDLQNNIQNMKINILLLDEVFDSLDNENIEYVSSLLRTLIKDKSINIISHRHIDSIESDEVIRLF